MVSYERLRFVAAPRQEKKEGRSIEQPYDYVERSEFDQLNMSGKVMFNTAHSAVSF
jgi:hypothetical protein